jgi:hypothetical protein
MTVSRTTDHILLNVVVLCSHAALNFINLYGLHAIVALCYHWEGIVNSTLLSWTSLYYK